MKIAVFLKQVPDNTRLKPEQIQGANLPKEGVDMMMNPFDEYALETAIRLKEANASANPIILAFSLGAESAREILKKAIAAGADEAVLLSDPELKGGDNTATAYALAEAVRKEAPDTSVLLFGQQALDDLAGVTGPQVAEILGYPSITGVKSAVVADAGKLLVQRETEDGIESWEVTLPAVLCMVKCDYELRTSNIKGVMRANKAQIPVKTAGDIGLSTERVGRSASPTQLLALRQRPPKQAGQKIQAQDAQSAANEIFRYLKDIKVI